MTKDENRFPWTVQLRFAVIALLLWALAPTNPYGYYIILRWVLCPIFVYLALAAHEGHQANWVLLFAVTAGIYNPIVRLGLGRPLWSMVNLATIVVVILSLVMMRRTPEGGKHS